jgi:hypothetical protein
MKTSTFFSGLFYLFFCVISLSNIYSQVPDSSYSGTYTLNSDGVTVTLVLKQDVTQQVSGTLTSTTGISYQLQGEVVEDAAMGICSGKDGSVYFEIYKMENELILSLIEPDGNNMPDYNTATYLSLTKISTNQPSGWSAGAVDDVKGTQQEQLENIQPQVIDNQMKTKTESQPLTGKEIGDPSWGFKFIPPSGWVYQQATAGWILGHNTIPGMIIILPHMMQNMQEVQQEMLKGIQEEGSYLQLTGNLTSQENNILTGDY